MDNYLGKSLMQKCPCTYILTLSISAPVAVSADAYIVILQTNHLQVTCIWVVKSEFHTDLPLQFVHLRHLLCNKVCTWATLTGSGTAKVEYNIICCCLGCETLHIQLNILQILSEKSTARPKLFYSTNYWQQFWVQFVV